MQIALATSQGRDGGALNELFRRYYKKVSGWCLRFTGRQELTQDLAQEVFLRVQGQLHNFRGDCRFSTWLYIVTRSTAINYSRKARRRDNRELPVPEHFPEPTSDETALDEGLISLELARELKEAMDRDLSFLEQRVLYLHFVDAMTLPAITDLLQLENKSGAKAYIVSAKRKLARGFGPWLEAQLR